MRRLLKVLLSLNSLRKALGFNSFFAATKFDHHLEVVNTFRFKNILVLSPHPDDDVFALGGTIVRLVKNGAQVTVAYFCDGSRGLPLENEEREMRELGMEEKRDKDLIERRKVEAKEAGKILGIENQIFFGYPDGQLASGSSAIRALLDLMNETKPDIIFVPSFLDNHPDHRVTNEIFMNALSQLENQENFEVWAYEVWTPIYPNRLIAIGDVLESKKEAIKKHQSQLDSRNYLEAILGLNQYRAEINDVSGYAEAFFATTPRIYRDLYRKS